MYPFSPALSQCLPALPVALRWGALGLLGSSLLLCGGEGHNEHPTSSCWIIDNRSAETAKWRHHSVMKRARSQSASVVSTDGSILQMISGYNPDEDSIGLPSIQFLSTEPEGRKKETAYPASSRLAAAVSLRIGILVTGGLGTENQVWFRPSLLNGTWIRRKDMLEGRKGHGSCKVKLGGEENVIVAGGWDGMFEEMNSVEMYNQETNLWRSLPKMLNRRVDFALQVSEMTLTAVGGHFTVSKTQQSPSPWSLRIISSEEEDDSWAGEWVDLGGNGGTSGAMTASVPRQWIENMCRVKGMSFN